MGVQITKVISANGIKNGTMFVQGTAKFPLSSYNNARVIAYPDITVIQSKYDTRFDDYTYYTA